MEKVKEGSGLDVYKRLLTYIKPFKLSFGLAVFAMAIFAVTDTGFAALMKPLLDGSFVDKDPEIIKLMPLAVIGIFFVRGIAGFISVYCMSLVGRGVIKELRKQMFNHLLVLPTSFYDQSSSGKLISKVTYDVEQVAQAATGAITIIVRDTLTVIGLLGWMFYLNWQLSVVFIFVGPVIALLIVYVNKRFRRYSKNIQNSMGDVTHIVEEAISGQRVVKIFGGQQQEKEQFEKANETNRSQYMKMMLTSAASVPVIQFIAACLLAGVIYMATLESMLESISVGTFMSLFVALMMLLAPLKRLTTVNAALQKGITASQSIFSLIDEFGECSSGAKDMVKVKGEVQYRNVSFAYTEQKGTIIDDVSFSVGSGQTVAFVGKSGSGKSTLINLLARFYIPSAGEILIDGVQQSESKLESMRSNISLVSQDVTLFNDTLYNNIAYGELSSKSKSEVVKAAEQSYVMEYVKNLPDGLDTVIGESGVMLSGGERQRLSIARALLKRSPILILDEATSALDSESERYIQEVLKKLMKGCTTFVIAHRLSTIENADKIIVIDKGKVVEEGTHKELIAKGEHYALLHQLQSTGNM